MSKAHNADTIVDIGDADAIIEIAQKAVRPFLIDDSDGLLYVPGTDTKPHEIVDLDKYGRLSEPRRKTGSITVFNIESMNVWIDRNKDAGNITIYLDSNAAKPAIIAVLNDHGDKGPGFRDLRCSLAFRPTIEWQKWSKISGEMLPQAEFAEFIEENLNDIFDPPGAQMLEIVTFLQATRAVDFKSAVLLSSGQVQFQNIESIDATVSASQLAVPREFTLAIAPIQGAARFKIPARFRYRLDAGKLRLGLKLLRLEDVISQIFESCVNDIMRFPELTVVDGTP